MKKNIIIRAVAIVFASAQTAVLSARDIVWFDGKSPGDRLVVLDADHTESRLMSFPRPT